MQYSHLISDRELVALRTLLGRSIGPLYTRELEARGPFLMAPDFSIGLERGGYCVIESDWDDTPKEWIDYHMIEVSIRNWPKGVGQVNDQNGRSLLARCSSVVPTVHFDQLTSIQVLEYRESGDSEAVHYDHALIFTNRGGGRFSIAIQQSIAGGLEFCESEPRIEEIIRHHAERVRLCL